MKIVSANKFYFLKGGAERYAFELSALLESRGHAVVPFAMRDGRNLPSEWSRYFVSPVSTDAPVLSARGIKTAGRFLYSFEARRRFAGLLDAVSPDIVHLHNIYHQISPSILSAAKKRRLPTVMTAHDYNLIAPNYLLFHDGLICERTKPNRYLAAMAHRCVRGSAAAGALEAVEMGLHRVLKLYREKIDRIIAPSRFMQTTLAAYGVDPDKITHVPHFVNSREWTPRYEGEYALFVGRLSAEKGVDVLVRAAAKAREVPVRIVGAGPEENKLKALAARAGAANVDFRGFKSGAELSAEYAGARFVVAPSIWYEVFGLIALEAYAAGKPVIASRIGGLSEIIRDGETGFGVSAGHVDGLAERMSELWNDPVACARLGRAARALAETEFSPDKHYERIMAVYNESLSQKT